MRRSKFMEEQIVYALKQAELGVPVLDVCRKYGVSEQTFYRWRKKYGGLETGELRRLKQLEDDENRKLKQLMADLSLDKHVLQDVIAKKLCGPRAVGCWSGTPSMYTECRSAARAGSSGSSAAPGTTAVARIRRRRCACSYEIWR